MKPNKNLQRIVKKSWKNREIGREKGKWASTAAWNSKANGVSIETNSNRRIQSNSIKSKFEISTSQLILKAAPIERRQRMHSSSLRLHSLELNQSWRITQTLMLGQ